MLLFSLQKNEFYTSPQKCEFLRNEMEFFELIIGNDGIQTILEIVVLIKPLLQQSSLIDNRCFLGQQNFFRYFARDFSRSSTPLTLLRKVQEYIYTVQGGTINLKYWRTRELSFQTLLLQTKTNHSENRSMHPRLVPKKQ